MQTTFRIDVIQIFHMIAFHIFHIIETRHARSAQPQHIETSVALPSMLQTNLGPNKEMWASWLDYAGRHRRTPFRSQPPEVRYLDVSIWQILAMQAPSAAMQIMEIHEKESKTNAFLLKPKAEVA